MCAEERRHNLQRRFLIEPPHNPQDFQFVFEGKSVARFGLHSCRSAAQEPICMSLCLGEKIGFARFSRLFNGRPNSATCLRDLLISVAARTAREIVQPIPGKNQMCMRINKSRKNDFPASIDNFRVACLLLDLTTGADELDSAVANQQSTIANDPELRQLRTYARPPRASERDQLRSVKNSQCLHDLLNLLSTAWLISLNFATECAQTLCTFSSSTPLNFSSFNCARLIRTFNAAPSMHARIASAPTPTSETDAGFPLSAISASNS